MQQILIFFKKENFVIEISTGKFNKRMFAVPTEKRCQQQLNTPKYIYSINIEKEI
jgi:hypothetical protein